MRLTVIAGMRGICRIGCSHRDGGHAFTCYHGLPSCRGAKQRRRRPDNGWQYFPMDPETVGRGVAALEEGHLCGQGAAPAPALPRQPATYPRGRRMLSPGGGDVHLELHGDNGLVEKEHGAARASCRRAQFIGWWRPRTPNMVDVSDMETDGVAMMEDDCGRSEDGGPGAPQRLM